MQRRPVRLSVLVALLCTAVVLGVGNVAQAQQATSTNYGVDEVFFGTGGDLGDCSGTGPNASNPYCAKISTGEFAQGFAADPSNAYQTRAGQNTNREEYLEMIVTSSSTDLGVLSPGTPYTTTGSFSVKDYLSSGYVVVNASNPPRAGASGHVLATNSSPTAYNSALETFGINLVANTSPSTVGADPVQVPDSTFSYGAAYSGYNTPNQFKYQKGDYIAQSTKSSGQTNYTVTYLFNTNALTPAGQYTFNHDMVALATY